MNKIYDVIKRPIISEKSTLLSEANNSYAFEVGLRNNKTDIKYAVEKLFNVKVVTVRTMVMHGEKRRTTRTTVKRPNWKKAIVKLKAGDKIQLFQGV